MSQTTNQINVSRHNAGTPILLGHFAPTTPPLVASEVESWIAEDGISSLADCCEWHGVDGAEYEPSGDDVYEIM